MPSTARRPDLAGDIIVGKWVHNALSIIDHQTGAVENFLTGFSNPIDVTRDPFDNLLALSTDGQLIRISISDVGPEGDYNGNGIVDAADYTVWRDQLGAMIELPNEDPTATPGRVTIEDYDVWKSNFGQSLSGSGAAGIATVPEPSAGLIALIAACLAAGWPVRLKGWTPRI
jgi:hypothetical protein